MRRSMQLLLQGRGYDVRAHATAETLLLDEHLTEADCLISDYRLADGDGINLIGMLRDRGWCGPAILVTAYATDSVRGSAIEAGFGALLEKPLKEHVLISTVSRLVRSARPT